MRNIVKEKPGPKGNGCQAVTPFKSFELFFDDAMITEIVTWNNQKIENVETRYTSKPGFLYSTSVTEIRALIGILLFLGATKSTKESTASIWAKDVTGKPICIAAMSQKRFFSLCIGYALTIQPRGPSEEPMTSWNLFATNMTNLS